MKIKYFILVLFLGLIIISTGCFFNTKKINIEKIKSFHFSYTSGYEMYSYTNYDLKCEGHNCKAIVKPNGVSEDDKYETEVDSNFVKEIEDVLNKYNVAKWNGFNKSDKDVLDGDSFSMSIRYGDDGYISASGYMMWPDNYSNVRSEISSIFIGLYKEIY